MHSPARCVLLSIGTELTEGKIQDSHLRFFAQALVHCGLRLSRCVHAPDDRAVFVDELRRAAGDAEAVFVTGGLGPTSDDLTRDVVAEVAGVGLVYYPEVWTLLEKRFPGRPPAEANRRQCYAPAGFSLIDNPHGTAPGFHGRIGGSMVFALPGPPRELQPMFHACVLPLLTTHLSLSVQEELLGTAYLLGESALEDALRHCAVPGVGWGTRFADDRVSFYLRGGSSADREALFGALERLVGSTHIRRGDRGAAEALFDALLASGSRIAVAESCTGGMVSSWITDIAGSSSVFLGGVVAYANATKVRLLGVEEEVIARHGAVSSEVVRQMAAGVRQLTGAEYGLAVSGVAGPGGGTPEKPVGTVWVSVAAPEGEAWAQRFQFAGARDAVRRRSAAAACIMAECRVAGRPWNL